MLLFCALSGVGYDDLFFFFQAEDGIRDIGVTGVQTCALPICRPRGEQRVPAAQPMFRQALLAPGLENRVLRATVETVGGEDRNAEVTRPERVVPVSATLHLAERVYGEPPGAVEPLLVARSLEHLQEGVAVAGGSVADRRALLRPVRARTPGELGAGQQQLLG